MSEASLPPKRSIYLQSALEVGPHKKPHCPHCSTDAKHVGMDDVPAEHVAQSRGQYLCPECQGCY